MFTNWRCDLKRYTATQGRGLKKYFYLLFTQGIWAITVYRFGSWSGKVRIPLIGQLLRLVYFFLFKLIEITAGISIDSNAKIGRGFYIGHFGQIFIYAAAEIGENASIGQGVTIGTLGLGKKGAPRIGDNIYIGAGAKILGPIQLGHNVHVGANAVVLQDVPDGCTVVGIPGKILQRKDVVK
ncbi:MAG: serine O-acetyltransferase [bacterium]|nr:serine O-acetyltransferase [bacterium]